jgi:hypothetical protein
MKNYRIKNDRIKSDRIKSDRIKSGRIKSDRIKTDRIKRITDPYLQVHTPDKYARAQRQPEAEPATTGSAS